jgi:hypothetical protein
MLLLTEEAEDRLLTDATARITWGDLPGDVCHHLIREGMDPQHALELVNRLARERSAEVRRRSAIKLATGAAMLLAAFVFFTLLPWREWMRTIDEWYGRTRRRSGISNLLPALFVYFGVGGAWRVWRGISGLLTPQAEELSDVIHEE